MRIKILEHIIARVRAKQQLLVKITFLAFPLSRKNIYVRFHLKQKLFGHWDHAVKFSFACFSGLQVGECKDHAVKLSNVFM